MKINRTQAHAEVAASIDDQEIPPPGLLGNSPLENGQYISQVGFGGEFNVCRDPPIFTDDWLMSGGKRWVKFDRIKRVKIIADISAGVSSSPPILTIHDRKASSPAHHTRDRQKQRVPHTYRDTR